MSKRRHHWLAAAMVAGLAVSVATPAQAVKIPIFFGDPVLLFISLAVFAAFWAYGAFEKMVLEDKLKRVRPLMASAHDHHAAGRFEDAAADYAKVLAELPKLHMVRMARGHANAALGKMNEATADFSAVIVADKTNVEALFHRANIHRFERRHDQAISDLTRVIKLTNGKFGHLSRGLAQAEKGADRPAIEDFTLALARARTADGLAARAASYARIGEADKAARDLADKAALDAEAGQAAQAAAIEAATATVGGSGGIVVPGATPASGQPAAPVVQRPQPVGRGAGTKNMIAGTILGGLALAAVGGYTVLAARDMALNGIDTMAVMTEPLRTTDSKSGAESYSATITWTDKAGKTQSRAKFAIPNATMEQRLSAPSSVAAFGQSGASGPSPAPWNPPRIGGTIGGPNFGGWTPPGAGGASSGPNISAWTPPPIVDNWQRLIKPDIPIRYLEPAASGRVVLARPAGAASELSVAPVMFMIGGFFCALGLLIWWATRPESAPALVAAGAAASPSASAHVPGASDAHSASARSTASPGKAQRAGRGAGTKLVIGGAIAAGLALAGFGGQLFVSHRDMEENGIETMAVMTEPSRTTDSHGVERYTAIITWTDKQGHKHARAKFAIPRDVMDEQLTQRGAFSSDPRGPRVGPWNSVETRQQLIVSTIPIRYLEPAATGRVESVAQYTAAIGSTGAVILIVIGSISCLLALLVWWATRPDASPTE